MGDGDCWTCLRTVPLYRGGCGFGQDLQLGFLRSSACFVACRKFYYSPGAEKHNNIDLSDSFKHRVVSAAVVRSVTVGPRYGTGRFSLKSSVSDRLHFVRVCVCVFSNLLIFFKILFFFLHQETIEVESENVFKLAAFALQVRKSLSQASHTEMLSLSPNVNEDGRGTNIWKQLSLGSALDGAIVKETYYYCPLIMNLWSEAVFTLSYWRN